MSVQCLVGKILKAIEDFNMIEENDKIAVGLSGGKDSLTLLHSLKYIQRFYNKKFEIIAITIHPGSDNFSTSYLKKFCEKLDIKYIVYNSNISNIVFDIRKETNPCSLCANLRRGMLTTIAKENGCNKIALGHHLDDAIETFLMTLFLNGKISTFSPVTYLSKMDITTIRPLIYIEEKQIRKNARDNNYEIPDKCCLVDGYTKRDYIKKLIKGLQKDIPKIRESIFGAITRSNIQGWDIEKNKNKKK